MILALESSCDETACAVVDGLRVRSSVVASQIDVHARFGGVVPELASRHHLDALVPVIRAAVDEAGLDFARLGEQLDAIAVTDSPGLVGALLVGVQAARGLALATGLPLYGVHHMEGHLFSPLLREAEAEAEAQADTDSDALALPPHLALLVSGGHTELVRVGGLGDYTLVGATRDDAAGEAFDKVAKLLGLRYPGGPIIDRLAKQGDPEAVRFPRAMLDRPNFDFSFSGLKTAVAVHLERNGQPDSRQGLLDLCASFQAAVVEVLVAKTCAAARAHGCERVHVVGGVAANSGLRGAFEDAAKAGEIGSFVTAPLRYCGDNAAMIAAAGGARHARGWPAVVDVDSSVAIDDPRLAPVLEGAS
ncbi:tRNA (adenosine(37)-N6)-threonylcarbamoyltransferase complex transferase subunit TsaD [Pseudenhygromyxa sp. WMMC2535]|uniref:tRNA (adenosine(37)-N6)-threonylcarbamoyltransferase complex transferase subunit TsaD n=1 Tax=Pseudenhygromyxa sp. WMMC2535 TaxID=2712867 RepID=UPI0015533DEF|nr:tRNA (adenosine(37)-N6)-threonylcarbamoyltransferase complex transferase subunit TsaD [Pseudenhygromyxa sp. WMMC2535]